MELIKRVGKIMIDINRIIDLELIKLPNLGTVSFRLEHSSPNPIMTEDTRMIHMNYIMKVQALGDVEDPKFKQSEDSLFYLENINEYKHTINSYRALIYNQNDSVYYTRLCKYISNCFLKRDSMGLKMYAFDIEGNDISNDFIQYIKSLKKYISELIRHSDLDFLYNGVLQHSDIVHTNRYNEEYRTGKLDITILKNVILLDAVKFALERIMIPINFLTFPSRGGSK